MDFENKVKNLRIEFQYTQEYVARKLGISHTAYRKYEKGKARPEYERLVKLANLYEVSVDFLLDNDKNPMA